MKNIDCRIDPINSTITLSKRFAKAAGKFGTAEYKELRQAMKDHPDYAVVLRTIKKKQDKQSYYNLTYKHMREYITAHIEDEAACAAAIAAFEKVQALSKIQAGAYAYVKNWFLTTYPDYRNVVVEG